MTWRQARTATIIETTPCEACHAAPKQPCRESRPWGHGKARIWTASVHFARRLQARRIKDADPRRWHRLMSQAKEISKREHAEYLRKQVTPE